MELKIESKAQECFPFGRVTLFMWFFHSGAVQQVLGPQMWILTSCCSHLPRVLLQLHLPFQCRLQSGHWSKALTGDCQQAQKARTAAQRFSNILLSTSIFVLQPGTSLSTLLCRASVCSFFHTCLSADLFFKTWSCRVIQDGTHNPLASAS